jgi:hypothetical protein
MSGEPNFAVYTLSGTLYVQNGSESPAIGGVAVCC